MNERDLEKCLAFIVEAERLKSVNRKTKPIGSDRYENAAEHSWQVALLATVLAGLADEPVDLLRVLKMLLVHDLGEIDAGDAFFFDDAARAAAGAAESDGIRRLFSMLPAAARDEMTALWVEFETGVSAEARFARAIDRTMPILQNLNNDRQSWDENGVTMERILERTRYIADASPDLWDNLERKIRRAFAEKGEGN